jgi:hypothetical protein
VSKCDCLGYSCSQTESPAVTVTDMLIAILNCCTKEELEEDEEEEATPEEAVTPVQEGEPESNYRSLITNVNNMPLLQAWKRLTRAKPSRTRSCSLEKCPECSLYSGTSRSSQGTKLERSSI